MSKFIGAIGFMVIGATLLTTGLFTYLELGNLYYETDVNGKDTSDIVRTHFENAKQGWRSI